MKEFTDLDGVVAGGDSTVLNLNVGRRVSELALSVWPRALVTLELPADLQLQPAGVLHVEEVVDVDDWHTGHPRAHHGAVGGVGGRIQRAGWRDSPRSLNSPSRKL